MKIVHCTAVYYDDKGIQHTGALFTAIFEDLTVDNLADIRDVENIHNIVINTDVNRIIQANGYSEERGLFFDLY